MKFKNFLESRDTLWIVTGHTGVPTLKNSPFGSSPS